MVLLLLCLTCVIPCVIIGVYSDTRVLLNGDVLYMGSNESMTFQEAEQYCSRWNGFLDRFNGLLEIGNGIDRDEIKKLTAKPVWTGGFRNNETMEEYHWTFSKRVNFAVTPMDNSKVCEAECCRLVFDPSSGKVFPVVCHASEKFSIICQSFNKFRIDSYIENVKREIATEKSNRTKEIATEKSNRMKEITRERDDRTHQYSKLSQANSNLQDKILKLNYKVIDNTDQTRKNKLGIENVNKKIMDIQNVSRKPKESLKSTNDSIDSLRLQISGTKNTALTALVVVSLTINAILGVLFYMLYKKVNSRS